MDILSIKPLVGKHDDWIQRLSFHALVDLMVCRVLSCPLRCKDLPCYIEWGAGLLDHLVQCSILYSTLAHGLSQETIGPKPA